MYVQAASVDSTLYVQRIGLRVTAEQVERWKLAAGGRSLSAWIKATCDAAAEVKPAPSPRPKPQPAPEPVYAPCGARSPVAPAQKCRLPQGHTGVHAYA